MSKIDTTVGKLVDLIQSGELRLPEMPRRDLAVIQAQGGFNSHKLLLDGQQRLTSLSAILRGEPVKVGGKKKPIEILFNLDHPDGPPLEVIEVEDDAAEADDSEA